MKINVITLCFLLLVIGANHAQTDTEEKSSSLFLTLNANSGQAKVENDGSPNYNFDVSTSELLLNYNFNENTGIATGLGYTDYSGNGFNTLGNFFHERQVLKIPVLLTTQRQFNKIIIGANIGLYGQVIINDDYQFLTGDVSGIYDGWSFGLQGNINILYQVTDKFGIGVNLATQSDFSGFETKNNAPFTDEQTITQQNTIGLMMSLKL